MKRVFVLIAILSSSLAAKGQNVTTNQNYILTRTYTAENGSASVADVVYYDGLGYPSQSVSIGASPIEGKSIVVPVYYDAMRRESRKYLPYAAESDSGAYQEQALADQVETYNAKYGGNSGGWSYTENVYEASPLNRVMEAYNVGVAFRSRAGIKSTFAYGTNTATEVLRLKVNPPGLQRIGYYNANTLFKNTTTNEDGAKVETYTDFQDRVVLERTIGDTGNIDTYYVYDDMHHIR